MRPPRSVRVLLLLFLLTPGANIVHGALWQRGQTIAVASEPAVDLAPIGAAVQPDGSFLLAWIRIDDPRVTSRSHVFTRAFDANGVAQGVAHEVLVGETSAQLQVRSGGGYLLTWEHGGFAVPSLFALLLDGQGLPVGTPFPLSDVSGGAADEYYLRVAIRADGNGFAALWAHSIFNTTPAGTLSVDKQFRLRLFAGDGTPLGPSREVNPLAHVSNADGGFGDVAATLDGGFCVVWSWELTPGANASILARRFDTTGGPTTAPIDLGVAGVRGYGESNFPHAVAHDDSRCTLAWRSFEGWLGNQPLSKLHVVTLGANGAVSGDRPAPAIPGEFDNAFASDGHRGVYVLDVPYSSNPSFPRAPAHLRRLDATGNQTDPDIEAAPRGFGDGMALSANASGDVVVAWSSHGTGPYPDPGRHDILARRFGATCSPAEGQLCLGAGDRFALDATWHTPADQGVRRKASPVAITADTGGFWFFTPSNLELLVKVLDGRAVNGHYWVFFGGLTNLNLDLTVADTVTGAKRTYTNPAGAFPSRADVAAFTDDPASVNPDPSRIEASSTGAIAPGVAESSCTASPTAVCLHGHYKVEIRWRDFAGNQGDGHFIPASGDSAYSWFFASDNVEMAIKVLDGTAVNGHIWVFSAGLTSVTTTLTVTDTDSGSVRTYTKPAGTMESFGDTSAF